MKKLITLLVVCFSLSAFAQNTVTFTVDMNNYAGPAYTQVELSGSWLGWCAGCRVMTETAPGSLVYTIDENLPNGTFEYKFTANGFAIQENLTPGTPCTLTSGPFTNRLINITGDTDLGTVCWESCDACDVQPQTVDITFELNMASVGTAGTGVFLAGGGNFGNPGDNPMVETAPGSDIYTITVTRPAGFSSFYTFTNGLCPDYSCKEDISGQACANPGNFNDRFLPPVTENTTISTCFGFCSTDGSCPAPPTLYPVTFTVDMNLYTGPAYSIVQVAGDFGANGFNTFNPMTETAPGSLVYTTTLDVPEGPISYKFIANNFTIQENLGPGTCTFVDGNGNTNRTANIIAPTDLGTVCWESCDVCGPPPVPSDITFSVDMNAYTGAFSSISVGGTWNGFNPLDFPMTETSPGSGIYETTIQLFDGNYEYKFIEDGGVGGAEYYETLATGSSCTITTGPFTNRALVVAGSSVLPTVCFESCSACIDDCPGAVTITPSVFGVPAWETFPLGSSASLPGCPGDADDDIWFSFTANSANDAILAQDPTGGYDAVIELFDGCGGASLGCFNNYGSGAIERALPGGLTPGQSYVFRVYDAATGASASTDVRVQVKTFEDSQLRAPSCGATDLSLDQVIYAENDAAGQLYSNPGVPVTGYAFRFQEQGGALDVTIEQPATDGFYFQLLNAGLEYGKSYDVSVSHRVNVPANGFIDTYWSPFGTVCSISMAAANPTTQLRAEYCTGAAEYYLSDQLQADVVIGASDYRFTFVPAGPFNTLVKESANYAVNLQTVGSAGNRLQYGVSYTVTVEALVNGIWSAPGSVCTILMATQPEDTEVKSAYCGDTYSYPSSNFILAESVVGATAYEFQFSPQPSGTALTKLVNTVSFAFGPSSLPFVAGTTYNVQVRAYSGAISGDYVDTGCEITILAAPMMDQENLTSNEEAKASAPTSSPVYSLFPNPNDGKEFMVSRLDGAFNEGAIGIEILDITGKLLHSELKAVKGDSRLLVNPAQDLSTGMYLLRITDEKGSQTLRFTVD